MVRLSDAAIDEISAAPKKALHFWMQEQTPEPEPLGWLDRLLGKKEELAQKCSVLREPGDETDLDKAWDGMDYLLSNGRAAGGVARFLTEGGEEIPEELGYAPPRVIRSPEIKEIAAFLSEVTPEMLRSRYDGRAMDREKIYPEIWARDGEDGFDYIISFFEPLRTFISDAAQRGAGIMIIYS
jgi:hypothetical protein